jgi:hypothetical protein
LNVSPNQVCRATKLLIAWYARQSTIRCYPAAAG